MTNSMTGTMPQTTSAPALPAERSLLIVEDDKSFLQRLARAMEGRGFVVTTAESVADGLLQVEKAAPAFAVVDMRLGDGNGLDVISAMKRRRPEAGRRESSPKERKGLPGRNRNYPTRRPGNWKLCPRLSK